MLQGWQWSFAGVLQELYRGIRGYLKRCYRGSTNVLEGLKRSFTEVLLWCDREVTRFLQGYYRGFRRVIHQISQGVTEVLKQSYKVVKQCQLISCFIQLCLVDKAKIHYCTMNKETYSEISWYTANQAAQGCLYQGLLVPSSIKVTSLVSLSIVFPGALNNMRYF